MITILKHSKKNAAVARVHADAVRNSQISQGKGALLLSADTADAEPRHVLEKIIDNADPFQPGTPAKDVNWKKDAVIVAVDGAEKQLAGLEKICPGFLKQFGSPTELNLG